MRARSGANAAARLGGDTIRAHSHRGNPHRSLLAGGERASSLLSESLFFVKRSPLAIPITMIALASLLAACSSGTTGMLPANPQTQSLSQAPNRAADAATSGGGMHATAHTPNGNTLLLGVTPAAGQSPIGATPVGNFGSGIGMARPMAPARRARTVRRETSAKAAAAAVTTLIHHHRMAEVAAFRARDSAAAAAVALSPRARKRI
uniref:Uncharacterized protein n=1 Tax=mine drainage metagenome TaxID=410659 RepID=E6Q1H0_9ZZZZ